MKRKIKGVIVTISHLLLFLKMESGKNRSLGFGKFIRNSRHGFFSISEILYDLKNNRLSYLSDWRRLRWASKISGVRRLVLDDKLLFHKMNASNARVLPILAVTMNGAIRRFEESSPTGYINEMDLRSLIKDTKHKGVIIKPQTGGGGAGITSVVLEDDKLVFKGHSKSFEDFLVKIKNSKVEFIFTEIIKQGGILGQINPHSLNTIRILTMIDPTTNEPFIAMAVQRFGVAKSGVVDNFTSGGISADIDLDSGLIGKGATYPLTSSLAWYSVHPDTDVQFSGVEVPLWSEIKQYILNLAREYYYIPYIGWDVVPCDDCFYILEGNSNSDVNVFQIHRPLLEDLKIKEFYKYHKIID